MFTIFLLALALAMDDFAVSLSLGVSLNKQHLVKTACFTGLYFGLAQGFMPFIGHYFGNVIFDAFPSFVVWTSWLACFILLTLGIKIIWDSLKNKDEEDSADNSTANTPSHKTLLLFAIATSIDALAIGLTLNQFPQHVGIICLTITLITALLSMFGVFFGKKIANNIAGYADIFGGMVLIFIGFKLILA